MVDQNIRKRGMSSCSPSLQWKACTFAELSSTELYQLLQLRAEVFVVEQACAYQDIDGLDLLPQTYHVLGYDGETLAAYLRIMAPGTVGHGELDSSTPVIGRVITRAPYRGKGIGHDLIQQGIMLCEQHWPGASIHLSAQAHLQGYYGQHGFEACGEGYLEDGIPHIGMNRLGH